MKIAVVGCVHGELDKIYEAIQHLEKTNSIVVNLLIICGDFQAVRNPADIHCMAVPEKYRKLNTFYKYYSGAKKAPLLTIFIGGNHEASNYLSELPYGGWVCPNIYYLGFANVISVGGLRIAGLSGIYKGRDYLKGRFECPPYNESSKRSVYHIRNVDIFRLKQIKNPIDIFISHDWPSGVYNFGNKLNLLRQKPYFRNEINSNSLGSKPAEELLKQLKPSFWFAAHLHCKFAAVVPHEDSNEMLYTKFLALDKCLPHRDFLQIVDIESSAGVDQMKYDLEWLTILNLTNHLLSVSKTNVYMPGNGCSERWDFSPSSEEKKSIFDMFNNELTIPKNFMMTAPSFDLSQGNMKESIPKVYANPQTQEFCRILNLTDPLVKLLNHLNGNEDLNSSFDTSKMEVSDTSDDEPETTNTDLDISGGEDFFIDKVGNHSDLEQQTVSPLAADNLNFPEIKEPAITVENPLKKFKS